MGTGLAITLEAPTPQHGWAAWRSCLATYAPAILSPTASAGSLLVLRPQVVEGTGQEYPGLCKEGRVPFLSSPTVLQDRVPLRADDRMTLIIIN